MGYPNQEEIKNYERGICLETKRMLLQDLIWEDLEAHHLLISDPEVMYYLPDIMTHNR